MSNLSILFIPGSFSPLSVYQGLFEGVSKAGYEIRGFHPPSVGLSSGQGRDGPAPSMYDDAAAIAHEVEKLADQGKDVILMGHSYAGLPMSQSTKGLGKEARKNQNKLGGVVQLAYIACLFPVVGNSAATLLSRLPSEKRASISIDGNGWMMVDDPVATARIVCGELPAAEAEAIMRNLAKHSAQSFSDELTYAGYMDIPASYLLCEKDLAGPADFQREMIAKVEEASGRRVDVTSIQAGHFPNFSAEEETIEWVGKVVKKAQESQRPA